MPQKSPNARAAPPEALDAVSLPPTLAEQVRVSARSNAFFSVSSTLDFFRSVTFLTIAFVGYDTSVMLKTSSNALVENSAELFCATAAVFFLDVVLCTAARLDFFRSQEVPRDLHSASGSISKVTRYTSSRPSNRDASSLDVARSIKNPLC